MTTEVIYYVLARQKGCRRWFVHESSDEAKDAIESAKRNTDRNDTEFEPGAGREYVAVKATTTYERL